MFEWMSEMNESGLAENTGRPEGNINHYLAVGNKTSAMTADTSAALGTVFAVLGSGQFPGVELGVAPLPGLPGDGATFVGGGANYIVKGDDPAKIEAAWRFAKFLVEPSSQATWAESGYIPIRQSAIDSPEVQQLWASQPFYKVAFDQLAADNSTVAARGPVIGDFSRRAQGRDRRDGADGDERRVAGRRARRGREAVERSDRRLQRAGRWRVTGTGRTPRRSTRSTTSTPASSPWTARSSYAASVATRRPSVSSSRSLQRCWSSTSICAAT